MEFFQEMTISHGSHFNPAYNMHTLQYMVQEHPGDMDAGAVNMFSRAHHQYTHNEEDMDATQCATSIVLHHTDSLSANSLGLCTSKLFCDVPYPGSASATHLTCKVTHISDQAAFSSPQIHPKFDASACADQLIQVDMQHQVESTSIDSILNLHHIEAGATYHSTIDPNHSIPKTLMRADMATRGQMPLRARVAVHKKEITAGKYPTGKSFLSALHEGDEAFFQQQLLLPTEGPCKDGVIEHGDTVLNDHDEEARYDQEQGDIVINDHEECNHPSIGIATDRSGISLLKNARIGSSACTEAVNMYISNMDDDEKVRARHDSIHSCSWEVNASRPLKEDIMAMHGNDDTHVYKADRVHIITPHVEALDSKKRSPASDHDSASCITNSKRAHLGPHGRHSNDNMMRQYSSSSTSSFNVSDTHKSINATSTACLPYSKTNARSSSARRLLGPALNTNLKPRARQGTANDPQTLASRNRRERINARLKVLQELVPNGSKVDLVTMLEKAINYVKFLQLQLRVLSNDEFWKANQSDKVAMQNVLSMDVQEDINTNSCMTKNFIVDHP